jgi:hypothetical protein
MDFNKIAQEIYDVHRYGGKGLLANIEKALKEAYQAGRDSKGIEAIPGRTVGWGHTGKCMPGCDCTHAVSTNVTVTTKDEK